MATTIKKNLPALRFSKFKGDWKTKKLKEISAIYDGTHQTPKYVSQGVPFYSVENVTNNNFSDTKFISEQVFNEESKRVRLEEGDILMTRIGDIGTSKFINWDVRASFYVSLALIKPTNNLSGAFLNQLIKTNHFQNELYSRTIHVAFPRKINLGEIGECIINIPIQDEQQKIASFLSSVDERLQQLQQQQSLLEQYKKGSVQQFFSQKLRFKDNKGKAYPNWKEKALGEIYTQLSTNSYSRENLNYVSGKIKNIHYGDIHSKFNALFDIQNEEVPYINEGIAGTKNFANQLCKEGDLVIADASEDTLDVGKCIELINLNNEKVVAGLHTILIRPSVKEVSVGFGGYLLASPSVKKSIAKIAQGTKVYSISARRLLELKVYIPCPEEQTKIANFLSAIDEQINTVKQQIAQTQQFKKGLLQQMFV